VETRPALGESEFHRMAREPETKDWWLTGESLIHVPAVMSVKGWNSYGSPGNMSLRRAQRNLMLWSDVVGQVYNGGVTQFFANYDDVLDVAQGALDDLAWPELSERYRLAASEYIHIEGAAVTVAEWRRYRANEHERMRSAARDVIKKAGKEYVGDEDMLLHHYLDFVQRGLIEEHYWDYPCCDAFNRWFWSAACKADSIQFIGDYISNNRAELCLLA
jgi:hypothetical protein